MKRNRKRQLNSVFNRIIAEMIATGNYTFNERGIPMTQTTARELRSRLAEAICATNDSGWLLSHAEICRFYDTSATHEVLSVMRTNGQELPPVMYMLMPTTLTAHRVLRPYTDRVMYCPYAKSHLKNCVHERRCIDFGRIQDRRFTDSQSFITRIKQHGRTRDQGGRGRLLHRGRCRDREPLRQRRE